MEIYYKISRPPNTLKMIMHEGFEALQNCRFEWNYVHVDIEDMS